MKTISRYIMTLALLITAVGGAWADELSESFTTNHEVSVYTGEHFKITVGDVGSGKGFYLAENKYATIEALNGEIITKVELTKGYYYINNFYCEVGTTNISGDVATVSGVNNTSLTFTALGALQINAVKVYYTAPEPDVKVTINEAKSEASFEMPQYDVTATYTIKRDISVDVTAQVGDGTQEQPRYRVKKDGNNKFIPADMEMAAVPALFTVNDGIEQKALTQTQDYIVQIYAIDAEGQPTGDPMTFATFTFEPGIYAVKAVAADGSDYAGETALSNTFQLFQGYEVQVAAKEFITYYKDEPLYADTETSADAQLYTIQSVTGDEAVLSSQLNIVPANTPMLVYNAGEVTTTFLLIPTEDDADEVTAAPEFVGTLEATTIAASTENVTNYAFNGKAFVFVKNAIPVAANKCWLQIPNSEVTARNITLVFSDEATKISNTNITNITNGDWYDLNGRKLDKMPTKKGIYMNNGRKVVVK